MPTALAQSTKPSHRTKKTGHSFLQREFDHSEVLRIAGLVAIVAIVALILAGLFSPGLRYSLSSSPEVAVDSPAFLQELEPLVSGKITRNNRIEVIENGENFYRAELDAMRHAQHSINIEAYIFHKGQVTAEVLAVLADRARSGVQVNMVLDALGSLSTHKRYFKPLKEAGGRVEWYHRLRLHNWFIANNRTHREITVVDGSLAFVGGAGYADWWRDPLKGEPSWRDTMFRVQGDAVRYKVRLSKIGWRLPARF